MRRARFAPCALLLAALAGCERSMHDMYEQPRLDPGEASPLFPDRRAERPPPPGSVPAAAGELAAVSSGRAGAALPRQWQAAAERETLPPVTPALLARGQERYDAFCLPCHSAIGDGDGPVVRRGFPAPASLHTPRLRAASDRHLYDVIGNGYGVMYPFADRIAPPDRWAIVAYVRALQLSQHAEAAQLPPALRARLQDTPSGGAR